MRSHIMEFALVLKNLLGLQVHIRGSHKIRVSGIKTEDEFKTSFPEQWNKTPLAKEFPASTVLPLIAYNQEPAPILKEDTACQGFTLNPAEFEKNNEGHARSRSRNYWWLYSCER